MWGKNKKDEPLVYSGLDELLDILAMERRKSLRKRKGVLIGVGLYVGFVVLTMIIMAIVDHKAIGSMGGSLGGLGGMIGAAYAASQAQQKGVQALAQFEDVRAVPRLIEMLEYSDKGLKTAAAEILQKLLPKMQHSDAAILSQEHHTILNRVLSGKVGLDKVWTPQIQVVILNALQQIGDESSVEIVEELSEGKGAAQKNTAVQTAAAECLPFLRQRAEQQRQMQTLLRASDGNVTSVDVLLRPASALPLDTHAEQLLRAAPTTAAELPEQALTLHPPAEQEEAQPLLLS